MFSVTLTIATWEVRVCSIVGMTETAHEVKSQICNKIPSHKGLWEIVVEQICAVRQVSRYRSESRIGVRTKCGN